MRRKIFWQRHDLPGHESCSIVESLHGVTLTGDVMVRERSISYRIRYVVNCDPMWATLSARVRVLAGKNSTQYELIRGRKRWTFNGAEAQGVSHCEDVVLAFTPATNCLPIRRFNLQVDESADVTAAWLRFPQFTVEPLVQRYTRIADDKYQYETAGGFRRVLTVDRDGFVVEYPELWSATNVRVPAAR